MRDRTEYFDEIKQALRDAAYRDPVMDDIEKEERLDATQRYAGENEAHFVEYAQDQIDASVKAMRSTREIQAECLRMYHEDEPLNYSNKEDWQSRVVIPKPHAAVQFAMSAIRKAFSPSFLSIENETVPETGDFWEKLMKHQLGKTKANFKVSFTDASGFGFAVGQGLEMIPVWQNGLSYALVEPWKIHRDPDATPRDPQSGMYWIHQEYIDYHVLKELEANGRYVNVGKAKDDATIPKDSNLTKEELAKRKNMAWERTKFRKPILTSEFWGTVLDPKGNLLLPNATYTFAGNTIISPPKLSPYPTLKWPGTSFSPIPDFLSYNGRGLLQGVRSLWNFMCSLLCLHIDNLNWVVNPMTEIDTSAFVDQSDLDTVPGKTYLARGTVSGNQAVRTVERKAKTADVLSAIKFGIESFEEGTFINDAIAGRTGPREVTAREKAQNLDQAMGVFGLMGENTEDGAINAIKAGMECVQINAGIEALLEVFPEEEIQELVSLESDTGVFLPELTGSFHVSGLTAILKDNETMGNIRDTILPLMEPGSPFVPYLKPYQILKAIEERTNLADEKILATEEEAVEIKEQEEGKQQQMMDIEQDKIAMEAERARALHAEKMSNLELDKIQALGKAQRERMQ